MMALYDQITIAQDSGVNIGKITDWLRALFDISCHTYLQTKGDSQTRIKRVECAEGIVVQVTAMPRFGKGV